MTPPTWVLVDSSAWVETLRKGGKEDIRLRVIGLLDRQWAAMTEPVYLELYRGVRGKKEKGNLELLRASCHWLSFNAACWEAANRHSLRCRENGLTVPMADLLIASCALFYGVSVLHCDQHFDEIFAITGQPQ